MRWKFFEIYGFFGESVFYFWKFWSGYVGRCAEIEDYYVLQASGTYFARFLDPYVTSSWADHQPSNFAII